MQNSYLLRQWLYFSRSRAN